MKYLLNLHSSVASACARHGVWLVPTLARAVFAGVLVAYFWASAMTKLDSAFVPSIGAYSQIFPRLFESVGYDASQMGAWHRFVALAGTYAEYALPALIVLGLFTRLAALGMIGFVVVQSLTDIYGHGTAAGAWFDRASDALILDQRAFWLFLLIVLVLKGPGPLSADRVLGVETVRLTA